MSEALQEIVALARRQTLLMELIEEQEQALSALKCELWDVQTVDLPAAMAEAGLRKFTLDSGEEITIKEDFEVGIKVEDRQRAYDWLESNGFGGLIKTEVRAEFGKGELEKAQKLLQQLSAKNFICELARSVHFQTLKAFVAEQCRAGKKIPMDLFGASPLNKAIIKAMKTTKGTK